MTERRIPKKRDVGGGVSHPAPFSERLYPVFANLLKPGWRVLDPFAGIGGIHRLRSFVPDLQTVGVELEPEWANLHPDTKVGDSRRLRNREATFDAIVTSPCYANRLADSYNASDPGERRSYRFDLGRELSPGNAGAMQWAEPYRELHRKVWAECYRVLKPGGLFALNIKNHIRNGDVVMVAEWHLSVMVQTGFDFLPNRSVVLPGGVMHAGSNRDVRASVEYVYVFVKS